MNRVRVATAVVAGLGLAGGLAGIAGASSGTIGTTGPDSQNHVTFNNSQQMHVDNNNDISATNNNPQSASSGDVEANHNTTAGDAGTGLASNTSNLTVGATVNNTGGLGGSSASTDPSDTGTMTNTGPDSTNKISFDSESDMSVNNSNCLNVTNNVSQDANSGKAKVSDNTTGGNATSGDAVNTSTTGVTFNVTN